jgi:hypothetical protein
MKNVTRIISFSIACMFASCAADNTTETKETTVVKEVEVVRVEPSTPENSTEVSFGNDGVKLNTKDGGSGTKIEVKNGSTKIEIKGE